MIEIVIFKVAGETMMNYMDKLIPLVIDNFQEQSSSTKRNVALNTLNQLVENTGIVYSPQFSFHCLNGV